MLGHEGAGVVEAVGAGVARVAAGDHVALSWAPACGRVRRSACATCRTCARRRGRRWGTGGLLDGTPRLSRDGEPVYHYSFLSTFAERAVVPERSLRADPATTCRSTSPALVGCAVTTGVGAVWRTAGVRPGERVAVIGCGGVGLSRAARRGRGRRRADRRGRRRPGEARGRARARRHRTRSLGGRAGGHRRARARGVSGGGVDYAIEATGRPEACAAAFLSTRARGAAVLIGIPRADAVLTLPALSIPRMERRVLGSIYGSSRPERDFAAMLDLYRRGRLPLDRLVSHRLPLDAVAEAFDLMRAGEALRVVLDLEDGA